MCRYCDREYPSAEKLHELFYWQSGKIHRQWLPRENFPSDCAFTLYNKLANQPCHSYSKHHPNLYYVHGMRKPMHSGLIKSIMDGKGAYGWYHRKAEDDLYLDDGRDKPIPPRYPKYAEIPANHRFTKVFADCLRG
jgi:hypothetical protein